MPQRGVGVSDEAAGFEVVEYRVRQRTVGGIAVGEQYVIPSWERVASFIGISSTFRTTLAVLMSTISNDAGSQVLVAVRSCEVQVTNTVNSGTTRNIYLVQQGAVPTAGVDISKVSVGTGEDASQISSTSVVVKGTTSSDGGTVTPISLATASRVAAVPSSRVSDAALQGRQGGNAIFSLGPTGYHFALRNRAPRGIITPSHAGIESLIRDAPVILRPGESLAVTSESATTGVAVVVGWVWEEYTLP